MDRTQINRMYLLAATSAGHAHPLAPPETPLTATTIFEELQMPESHGDICQSRRHYFWKFAHCGLSGKLFLYQ